MKSSPDGSDIGQKSLIRITSSEGEDSFAPQRYRNSKIKMTTQNTKILDLCSVILHFCFCVLHFRECVEFEIWGELSIRFGYRP
jgi:hypothetical protein